MWRLEFFYFHMRGNVFFVVAVVMQTLSVETTIIFSKK